MVMYLDEEGVRALLRWEELITTMETALAAFSSGRVLQPVRNMMTIEEGKRYLGIMPAVSEDAMGIKLVSFYPGNAGTGIPTHLAMILLFRPDTGEPLAVMDGRLITEMRTAAVSAAVTRYLAPAESRVLALLGSGVQARAHLEALSLVRDFAEVRVWSRTPDHARARTDSQGAWLKPGAHVNAVGSPRPTWRELDDAAMANTLVVDSREAVLKESGDVILSRAAIHAEVGEIFAGTKEIPTSDTTVFKSVGIAVEDIATAKLVYESACRGA